MAQATQGWKFLSSEGETDPVKNNSKPARWLDFSGESASGGAGGMCIFDHPKNLRHPSPWHVVADMPFFSPAPLFNGPHVLKAQESLTLRYRILVHAGLLSKAELEKEWKDFASRLTGAVRGQR
jgi:hypothetical protein